MTRATEVDGSHSWPKLNPSVQWVRYGKKISVKGAILSQSLPQFFSIPPHANLPMNHWSSRVSTHVRNPQQCFLHYHRSLVKKGLCDYVYMICQEHSNSNKRFMVLEDWKIHIWFIDMCEDDNALLLHTHIYIYTINIQYMFDYYM